MRFRGIGSGMVFLGAVCACPGAHAASLPGARPVAVEASTRFDPVVFADSAAFAFTRPDALASAGPAGIGVARTSHGSVPAVAECPALRLPWGPIESCTTAIVAAGVATSALVSAAAWWGQGFDTRFNVASEGWFGSDTYAGGIDKLGHAFSFYAATRLGTRALTAVGASPGDALRLSASVAFGFGLGVEVLDGLSRSGRYGFSWEDLAMNVIGIGFGLAMESNPEFDRRFAFRWMYSPRGRSESWYDHHTYLVALRLSGFESIGPRNPLRFLEVVTGYGASGFRSDFDFSDGDRRRRTVYLGLALNVTELLDRTVFRGDARGGAAHRWTTEALRYVQPPGTAAAFRHDWRP